MWKGALAGAFALVTIGSFSISDHGIALKTAAAQDVVLHESDIARLKSALKLTPAQEPHWHPVEASLHAYARHQHEVASNDNYFGDFSDGGLSQFTMNAVMLQHVKNAAEPLIKSLTEDQKRAGAAVLESLGVHF